MPGHVQDVVNAADDPEIAILVLARAVAGEIAANDFRPIAILAAHGIAPEAPHHGSTRVSQHQLTAGISGHCLPHVINDFRHDTEEWKGGGARFGGCGAGKRGDEHAAGLRLPPGIYNRTAFAAYGLVIPNPGFGIYRLTDGAEEAQRTQVM